MLVNLKIAETARLGLMNKVDGVDCPIVDREIGVSFNASRCFDAFAHFSICLPSHCFCNGDFDGRESQLDSGLSSGLRREARAFFGRRPCLQRNSGENP